MYHLFEKGLGVRTTLVLILLFQVVRSNEYESGLIQDVLYVASSPHVLAATHDADASISISKTFATVFSEAPQILYSCYNLYFETATSGGYIMNIVSQTTTGSCVNLVLGFTITVSAPTTQKIYTVLIKWLAFIDKGKQIISEDLYTPDATESFDETHYNQNFAMAVPVLNYFTYSAAFSFQFSVCFQFIKQITSVTTTTVSVTVTSTGISQIGFQILLAVASPVYLYGPTQYIPSGSQLYNNPYVVNSATVPALQQSDYVNFPLFYGLSSTIADPLDVESLSFSLGTSMTFSIGATTTCSIQSGWFSQMLISPRFQIPPLLLESFTQTEYLDANAFTGITVEIPQISKKYTSATATATSDYITLDSSLIGLQVIVVMECPFTYQHNYWFIGSVEDNKQYIADYFYCSDGFNRMQYSINFNDGGRMEIKQIQIIIATDNTQVQINQKLTNIQEDEIYRNLLITKTSAR